MTLAPKIILHCPISHSADLEGFVEQCLRDRVMLVAVLGEGAEALETAIDWIVVGEGTNDDRYLLTSAHPSHSIEEVLEFARFCDPKGVEADQIRL
jgi:hypothetical protein